jgi:phosphatidylethanolamine N-methyltransferase
VSQEPLMNDRSPHMTKLYGDSIRKEAGFVKVFKKVASRNAQRVAKKTTPGLRRVAREVKGTIDKVYEETTEALEEFLAKCTSFRPADTRSGVLISTHQLHQRLRR